jgi:hypothetical protein
VLLKNNITPIFLKGTANLLAGIYVDTAERMVGDIDFIFSGEDYLKAITILREFGYSEVIKYRYHSPAGKHYRRLQKKNKIAAIEIHSDILVKEKYRKEFNYSVVEKDSQVIKDVRMLSYANKLNLSIIAYQINDHGFDFKTMALRNAYDVFLLSKKTIAKDAVNKLEKLANPLNCFLASCYEIFDKVDSLEYNKTKMAALYLKLFSSQLIYPKKTKIRLKSLKIFLSIKLRLNVLYKSLIHKEYRVWLFRRLTDKNWYKEKLVSLGFKQ